MRSRKQRKLDREKLKRRNEAMSRLIGRTFSQAIKGKKCSFCGEKASGIGDGLVYCEKHFWAKNA
jgi:hypothetical protein